MLHKTIFFFKVLVAALLSTLLAWRVAQFVENGSRVWSVKDKAQEKDGKNTVYERKIVEYRNRFLDLQNLNNWLVLSNTQVPVAGTGTC